jgi:hypothetical protein
VTQGVKYRVVIINQRQSDWFSHVLYFHPIGSAAITVSISIGVAT